MSGTGKKHKRKGKARAKGLFRVKHRREMLLTLEAKDYRDVLDCANAIDLEAGLHLRRYKTRRTFVDVICHDPVRPTLVQFVLEIIARY